MSTAIRKEKEFKLKRYRNGHGDEGKDRRPTNDNMKDEIWFE